MASSDKAVGLFALLIAAFVFVYYTLWAIILPFFPADNAIHNYFPAREWAVRLPAFILVLGLAAIGSFVGMTIIKEGQKRRAKAAGRTA